MKKAALFALLAVVPLISGALDACTGLKLRAKDATTVHGRTFEFGIDVDTSVVLIPRGYEFQATTPNGPGSKYRAKYATVGAIGFTDIAVLDGLNEKGLSIGTFYFPGFAGYEESPQSQKLALSPVEFPNWIVTSFATIDEIKNALDQVCIVPTVNRNWGPTPAPFHYIVYDASGSCLVIEPVAGKLLAYDNPIGVLTNSPNFEWHLTNLRNYINLTPLNAPPITIDNTRLAPFGQGSGMVGLPGDFTPPSRFVRACIYSATSIPPDTNEEAVYQLFHILNQFDIPVGVARGKVDGVKTFDYTLVTAVHNPKTLCYYFRTFDDQSIRFVDLTKFDLNAKEIKRMNTRNGAQQAIDISGALK